MRQACCLLETSLSCAPLYGILQTALLAASIRSLQGLCFAVLDCNSLLPSRLQIWQQHCEWVTQHNPDFGPGIKERFAMAAGITQQQFEAAAEQRAAARRRLAGLLGGDGVLALPTAPAPAPRLNTPAAELDAFRTSLISLTCIAGLSGFPQVRLQGSGGLACAAMGLCVCDSCPVGSRWRRVSR